MDKEQIGAAQLRGDISDKQADHYMRVLPYVTDRMYFDMQGGAIQCFAHLGQYGQAEVLNKPSAGAWLTPLDMWAVMSDDMIANYENNGELTVQCETCGVTPAKLKEQ